MDFQLSGEQLLLREALSGYLARRYTFDERREAVAGAGWRPEVWRALAGELGLFGAGLGEADGGFGGGAEEIAVIAEELGRALVLEPYTEAVVVAGALLRGLPQGASLLSAVLEGSALVVPALYEKAGRSDPARIACMLRDGALTGDKALVVAAPLATHLIVSAREGRDGRPALCLVRADAPGLTRRDYRLIDGRPAADVTFTGTTCERLDLGDEDALERIGAAIDAGIGAQCAEAVGVMATLLERTVAYAKQREQFGRPIGTFQALQHRMADMAVALERARSMATMATLALKADAAGGAVAAERSRQVSAAKAYVAEALKQVAEGAVQVHGGIGTTDEIDVSHYFKRAYVLQHQFGTAQYHLGRMAAHS
ncbi:acyl-CoA dehydrogenase family protein [Novosphingobium sp.]|uniref:acyl-CoA dehydrogenase family protein n=1 Tax=Novosphingobium sp. TaxID=1874826 RepID=UPI0038B6EAA3